MTALFFFVVAVGVGLTGILLARSADQLGEAFRLDRSITGFLLLAAATSIPELVVSCQVVRQTGAADMAVGSLLGSCLMNLMILAVIDLSRRTRGRILSRKAAAHALAALASVLLAALPVVFILVPSIPTIGRFHVGSAILFAAYVLTIRLVFVDGKVSREADMAESPNAAQELAESKRPKQRPLALYLLATAGIFALASPLATTSESFAITLGLTGTFFGAVFLAFVTSLPEIVTTYEASRIDADDMAIGNVLGSNAFNLLILVAVDIVYPQPLFSVLGTVHAIAAMGVIITTSIAAMGMLYRVESRWWMLEPDALAVIVVALGFFYLLYVG